ncbi:hypothetical protein TIFTF001_033140 [Ficus carica]|uniref:Uncharacterized protein n=1 Tax=Ficus carica TaxID=3494 RepID=A0AA88DXW3_FICCA|nr:hypothetical protein TIFTF001_033140 [Ficus carica]
MVQRWWTSQRWWRDQMVPVMVTKAGNQIFVALCRHPWCSAVVYNLASVRVARLKGGARQFVVLSPLDMWWLPAGHRRQAHASTMKRATVDFKGYLVRHVAISG